MVHICLARSAETFDCALDAFRLSQLCVLQDTASPAGGSDQTPQTPTVNPSQIWKEIYEHVRSTLNDSNPASWPDNIDMLDPKHMERIIKGIEKSRDQLLYLLQRCSDKAATLGVSIEDLTTLATGHPLPPTIWDVVLRWISRQSGSGFLDVTGLQIGGVKGTISDHLERATSPSWQGTPLLRRVTIVSAALGQQILEKCAKGSSTLSKPAKDGLSKLKHPQSIAIVQPCDGSGSAVDGVWVTALPKSVLVKPLTQCTRLANRKTEALGDALSDAGLKNGNFTHQAGTGDAKDWHVFAKVVTHIFMADQPIQKRWPTSYIVSSLA